jgi:hypothetical protein
MAFEKRDFTGALFKNTKMTSDKSPTYTGYITIEGVEYWQSAWVKEGVNGGKFFTQAFKRKDTLSNPHGVSNLIKDDEIPF